MPVTLTLSFETPAEAASVLRAVGMALSPAVPVPPSTLQEQPPAPEPRTRSYEPIGPQQHREQGAISPAVRKLLEELKVDPARWPEIPCTGRSGSMTKRNVWEWYAATGAEMPDTAPPWAVRVLGEHMPAQTESNQSESNRIESTPNEPAQPAPIQGELDVETAQPAPTLEAARSALKALNDVAGMETCIEALARFGAKRVSEIEPDRFGDFIALCAQMQAAAEVAA